jgi:hypothetical protein
MANPKLVRVGTVGETPILADLSAGLGPTATVQLTADYVTEKPAGYLNWPSAQPGTRVGTFASGSTIIMFKPEADALVTAGAATYV